MQSSYNEFSKCIISALHSYQMEHIQNVVSEEVLI